MNHIMPDGHFKPATFVGVLRNDNRCLDYSDGKIAIVGHCHNSGGNQAFAYNYLGQIISSNGECLCEKNERDNSDRIIGFCSCHDISNTKWIFDQKVNITVPIMVVNIYLMNIFISVSVDSQSNN